MNIPSFHTLGAGSRIACRSLRPARPFFILTNATTTERGILYYSTPREESFTILLLLLLLQIMMITIMILIMIMITITITIIVTIQQLLLLQIITILIMT